MNRITILIVSIIFSFSSFADSSDFLSLCQARVPSTKGHKLCQQLNRSLFSKEPTSPVVSFEPKQLKSPSTKLDSKTVFIAFNDPNYVAGMVYCYFVFRKFIDMKLVTPDFLGQNSSGFAIVHEQLSEYQKWVDRKPEGKNCRKLVEGQSGVPLTNLEETLKDKAGLVAINPYASVHQKGDNEKLVLEDMKVTFDHERIHVWQYHCPWVENQAREQWSKLTKEQKAAWARLYPNYQWDIPEVAAREFMAFSFEKRFSEFLPLIETCQ